MSSPALTPDVTWTRPSDGTSVPGYAFGPPSSPSALVVFQEWWGITPQILAQAKQLSDDLDVRVLVPDLYRGKIGVDAEEASHLMSNLDFVAAVEDLKGAVNELKSGGAKKIGVVGFCMGGALTLASAVLAKDLVDCAVAFYGTPSPELCDVEKAGVPILAHFGEDDNLEGFSNPAAVEKLRGQLEKSGVEHEVHTYAGVGHGFMNDMPEMREKVKPLGFGEHKKDVADLAWQRTKEFFEKHVKA
eukprot:CAMPEP_0183308434 /NCGR_PEP_ID=MMETSP0160_2-20130417/21983_1 /TAXON_ID=2839 ORGANISM="Odontella Sinensis, Strain Grunow 1884" /NCGR_SAMPLE_ID=MMETSP0160_2 /ASSEMBLY_ACC=CAM_ASM_000250 /LENGTH=244 /DNA_ID=CAMNT_0025472275 /DNA_START=45 /DNA_END=779 /DNA_ORIENTATION=-